MNVVSMVSCQIWPLGIYQGSLWGSVLFSGFEKKKSNKRNKRHFTDLPRK